MPKGTGKYSLTRTQKNFAHELIRNPDISPTEAYVRTHKTNNRASAAVSATQTLKKPNMQAYLEKYDELAQITVIDVMQSSRGLKEEPAHARVALDSAKDILDRLHGKATQRIDTHSTVVTIALDLTNVADDAAAQD